MSLIRDDDPPFWRVVCLLAAILMVAAIAASQPPAEGAMGRVEDPFEHPVRMSGDEAAGHVLADGVLKAAPHEAMGGSFAIGKFAITVPPNGITADVLREHLKADVEILIRRKEPLVLSEIGRR